MSDGASNQISVLDQQKDRSNAKRAGPEQRVTGNQHDEAPDAPPYAGDDIEQHLPNPRFGG